MPQLSSGEALSTHRHKEQLLYFMLKPSHALAMEIDRQRRALGLDIRYPLDRFHITLQPFGDIRAISAGDLDEIRRAAASLREEPFDVTLNKLRSNALVGTRMRALRDFQHSLVARLEARGMLFFDYDFSPHLSLA